MHREFERPDVAWCGAIRDVTSVTLTFLEVNVAGGWGRKPRRFDLEDVTRVDFGGGYEYALELVAGPPLGADGLTRSRPPGGATSPGERPWNRGGTSGANTWRSGLKLGPAVPGELVLDCFALARRVRALDMAASPYDLSGLGVDPVAVETVEGRAEYRRQQAAFAEEAAVLRERVAEAARALSAVGVLR